MIETLRPLTEAERRLLRYLRAANERRRAVYPWRLAFAVTTTLTPLFLATAIYSNVGWLAAAIVWIVIGLLLSAIILIPDLRDFRRRITASADCLRRDQVQDIRIQAAALVAFDELDDEGAAYAFQLADEKIIFIVGQNFYPSARFPNNDFSLAAALDSDGHPAMRWMVKHGHRIQPTRTVPTSFKKRYKLPDHLTIINGRLDDVEQLIHGIHTQELAT